MSVRVRVRFRQWLMLAAVIALLVAGMAALVALDSSVGSLPEDGSRTGAGAAAGVDAENR